MLSRKADKVNTVIGPDTTIEGKINTSSSIRIDGKLIGEVRSEGSISVGKEGVIEGNLHAKNVTFEGKIEGDIIVKNHLYLASTSIVKGDISAVTLEMEKGASFVGQSNMGGEKQHEEANPRVATENGPANQAKESNLDNASKEHTSNNKKGGKAKHNKKVS